MFRLSLYLNTLKSLIMEQHYFSNFKFIFNSSLKLVSFLILSCFITETTSASVGGDISWNSDKKGEYHIKYRLYHNCNSAKTIDSSLVLQVRCLETNAVKTMSYDPNSYQISGGETDCPDTFCFPQKRVHTFESFLDFNTDTFLLTQLANGGCSFELELTTIWSGGNIMTFVYRGQFYISANLNICNIENSWKKTDNSPQFSYHPNIIARSHQHVY